MVFKYQILWCFYTETLPYLVSSVDLEGRVKGINYNNATRDSVLDLPLDQVQPFYRALRTYVDIMTRPENMVTYRMESGELTTHTSRLR